jgi:hypothetical protein
MKARGHEILELPTGQGLVVKRQQSLDASPGD